MAFNFNWSPLMADSLFYNRAQDLLTAALNKSPKPPIIIDDIVVTELNLGSIPPELEILEIGDLAEDRFRGIFKMSYNGDAYLTLKTVVQANPLNTYLLTRNEFTSMKPLAADAGLTIPLQITLSEFHLSGFVILVFSKQKGLTVVFRNDPLESLKVSSTFDSIPFVRDFLQKAIEGQLRQLFMDELPAIIHRLSLRLWVPEYKTILDREEVQGNLQSSSSPSQLSLPPQDPFLNPPSDPVDSAGNVLTTSEIGALSLDSSVEMHSLFSQKNLLRLAALADSQRTLSLFTPSIAEAAFRACAGVNADIAEGCTPSIPIPKSGSGLGLHAYQYGYGQSSPALSRTTSQSHVFTAAATTGSHLISDTASATSSSYGSRLSVGGWSGYGLNLGAGRHPHAHGKHGGNKKKKRRVVDLRKRTTCEATDKEKEVVAWEREKGEMEGIEDRELKLPMTTSETTTSSTAIPIGSHACDVIPEESPRDQSQGEVISSLRSLTEETPRSDEKRESVQPQIPSPRYSSPSTGIINDYYFTDRQTHFQPPPPPQFQFSSVTSPTATPAQFSPYATDFNLAYPPYYSHNSYPYPAAGGYMLNGSAGSSSNSNNSTGILEQALMMKMAGELARRMQQSREREEESEKAKNRTGEDERIPPPPPYRQ
ncbi:ERMES complex subunit [Ascosphaera aggregata]|nr:ERMES complex subunit [Ascosphaera aggregata]